jgi:hyperosmotically inducible periplasmic protein
MHPPVLFYTIVGACALRLPRFGWQFGVWLALESEGGNTMQAIRKTVLVAALGMGMAAALCAQDGRPASGRGQARLEKEVRHELVMLPFYGVFDNLAFRVDGAKVTLLGQVTKPTTKSDAERSVKQIEGVEQVTNQIEVLPLSPNDDRLRLAVFRAIYGTPGLDRYGLQAVPPIHIIMKNGNVSLEGAVGTAMDKTLAGMKANGVSGVFSVQNNLVVDK